MKSIAIAFALPAIASAFVLPRGMGFMDAGCSSADSFCCAQVVQLNSTYDTFLIGQNITLNYTTTPTLGVGCAPLGNGTCYSGASFACCTGETFHGANGQSDFPTNCTVMGTGTAPMSGNGPPVSQPAGTASVHPDPAPSSGPNATTVHLSHSTVHSTSTASGAATTPLQGSNNTVGTNGQPGYTPQL